MVWDSLSHEDRICIWKKLRAELLNKPLQIRLEKIAEFCKTMPRGRRTLDYYDPKSWPTPWEIIFHAEFCISSVSLVIFHTLSLTGQTDGIELWVVKDNTGDYLLPVIDNQFILNYDLGKVSIFSDVCDYFIVMQKFSKNDIKTIR